MSDPSAEKAVCCTWPRSRGGDSLTDLPVVKA